MTRHRANLLLLIAAVFWGTGNVAQKTILDDLGPFLTLGLRNLIGLLVIMPWLLRETRSSAPLAGEAWGGIAAVAVSFFLAVCLNQVALLDTSVTNASFLVNTTVVFSPVLGWLMLGERHGFVLWPIVGLAFCGILLMSHGLAGPRWGDALCVLSAFAYSVWIVLVARVSRRMKRPFTLAAWQFAVTGIAGLAAGAVWESLSWHRLLGAAPELLFLGVLSTGVGFTLQVMAQGATSAAEATVIMGAESVFGALAAAAILHETTGLSDGLGAALILSAILLIQSIDTRAPTLAVPLAPIAPRRADRAVAAE